MMMDAFANNQEMVLQDLLQRVESALRLLNPDVTREYREAVQFAPALVRQESRVMDFLRTEDYHTLRAATRIALYWKARKEFFGSDRWLRPHSMTGAGTLTAQQVELLRTGYQAPTASGVLLSNHARVPPQVTTVHPAVIFYILSVTTSEQSQTDGLILFHVISSGNARSHLSFAPEAVQKMRDCLPIRIKKIVVGRTFELGREHLLEYLAYAKQRQASLNLRKPAECVTGDSIKSTLEALQERGIDPSLVPLEMGGDYFYSRDFDAWVTQRLTTEGAMDAAPPIRNTEIAHAVAARQASEEATPAASSSAAAARPAATTNTSASDSISMASEDDRSSTTSGETLVKRRPGESQKEFEKRRTQVYGQRFHAKRKQDISAQMRQCHMLRQTNQALTADNAKLEILLTRARDIVVANVKQKS